MSRKNSVIIPWGLLFYTIRTGYYLILLPYVPTITMKKLPRHCFCIHIYLDLEFVSDSDSVQVLYRITDR